MILASADRHLNFDESRHSFCQTSVLGGSHFDGFMLEKVASRGLKGERSWPISR